MSKPGAPLGGAGGPEARGGGPEGPRAEGFTHFDERGAARMVDVSEKPVTERRALAYARVEMAEATLARILDRAIEKGDVRQVARIAGIQGAKRTSDLIPLCHPLPLSTVSIEFADDGKTRLEVFCEAKVTARTGVEMEALTGAAVAALTVIDMVKAIDRGAMIAEVKLLEKEGGRSGEWRRGSA